MKKKVVIGIFLVIILLIIVLSLVGYNLKEKKVMMSGRDCSYLNPLTNPDAYEWCQYTETYWNTKSSSVEYLENSNIKIGLNKKYGGAIFELFNKESLNFNLKD